MSGWLTAWLISLHLIAAPPDLKRDADAAPNLLRIAGAVEGVESSHGTDPRMWKPNLAGPQGPMQVSEIAALDVGGGDRFDTAQNREIGRAYLNILYRRYGNWTEAVAAYYWGPGNLDRWIAAGRPLADVSDGLRAYLARVAQQLRATPVSLPTTSLPASPGMPQSSDIKDPALRRTLSRNAAIIEQLQGYLDELVNAAALVDRDEKRAMLATIRKVAARPGYEEFGLAGADRQIELKGLKDIVAVLIFRLKEEDLAIAMVDRHRQQGHDR